MKKFIAILMTVFALFSLSSCEAYGQAYYMDNNGIVYEYSYESYPVRYINGVPYYYCLTNGIWNWIILPRTYYPYVVHHYPRHYVHPNGYRRPDVRFSHPHHNGGYRQPHNGRYHQPSHNGEYRHSPRSSGHGNIGGRGGSFNHSSSRGRR